jgi:hypothetical protein
VRVYNSDMKKMIRWFGILKSNNIEMKIAEDTESSNEPETEEVNEPEIKTPKRSSFKKTKGED